MITKTVAAVPVFTQPPVLLRAKMVLPPLPGNLVRRDRLLKMLERGSKVKLTMLSAPAGSGKTVLLAQWLSALQSPAAWLTLDERDNEPQRFFAYLLAALDGAAPERGGEYSSLIHSMAGGQVEDILTGLLNLAEERQSRLVIVLDDYHVIHSQSIHNGVAFLLEHLPANLRVVIATREEPPLPLARLLAGGHLAAITGQDMNFTRQEMRSFFALTAGFELSARQSDFLEHVTEGWAAGLQMAALAPGVLENESSLQAANRRQVSEYLSGEVLDGLPERVRSFLVQSALFERINAELCQAVFFDSIFPANEPRETSAGAMIDYCEKNNLFLLAVTGETGWYRFQKFFADLLHERQDEIAQERKTKLLLRASQWFEQKKLIGEAIHYARAAEKLELAADIITRNLDFILASCDFTDMMEWTADFPPDWLETKPGLTICRAWAAAFSARREDLESLLHKAGLDKSDPASAPAGYISVIRARLAAFKGDNSSAREFSLKALESIPDGSELRPVITFFLGDSAFHAADGKNAEKYLLATASTGRACGNLPIVVSALCRLAKVCKLEGRLKRAEILYREAAETIEEGKLDRISFLFGMVEVGLADLYHEWNRLEEAAQLLENINNKIGGENPNVAVFGLITAAGLEMAEDNVDAAGEKLRRAQKIAESRHLFFDILGQLENTWLHYWPAAGDKREISAWYEEQKQGEAAGGSLASMLDSLNRARAALLLDRVEEATDILTNLLKRKEMDGWDGLRIDACLLQARTWQLQGKSSQALNALKTAFDLAEDQGYRRIFLSEGRDLASVIRLGIKRNLWTEESFAGQLLMENESVKPGEKLGQPPAGRVVAMPEPLTDREVEILRLIADGFSNSEIAAELVLSVGTVKAHLHHILRKLEVDGRMRAVQRGRDLGLL